MIWTKLSTCLLSKCCKSRSEVVNLLETEEAGRDSVAQRSVAESDSLYGDVSLNLGDQKDYYYYYNDTPQMEECALKWLKQYKSEVR